MAARLSLLRKQPEREQMQKEMGFIASALVMLTFALVWSPSSYAQARGAVVVPPLIAEPVNLAQLVTLPGNTRPEATAANDRGVVAADFPMEHMLLQLRRSAIQEQALVAFIDQLHDDASPSYHQWLTPGEFGTRFGLATADLQK